MSQKGLREPSLSLGGDGTPVGATWTTPEDEAGKPCQSTAAAMSPSSSLAAPQTLLAAVTRQAGRFSPPHKKEPWGSSVKLNLGDC